MMVVPKGAVGVSRFRRGGSDAHRISAAAQRPVQPIFSVIQMALRNRGPGAAVSGSGGQDAEGRWGRMDAPPMLAVAATLVGRDGRDRRGTLQFAGDRLAVVDAAGKYAVQAGLIGDWMIISFEKIAGGPSYRAQGVEAFSFSSCLDVRRDRSAWKLTLRAPIRSGAGGRRLHRGAGVLADGCSGGCRGHAHRSPACHRGLVRIADASGIGRGARGGRVR